jgi:hypothetical protein
LAGAVIALGVSDVGMVERIKQFRGFQLIFGMKFFNQFCFKQARIFNEHNLPQKTRDHQHRMLGGSDVFLFPVWGDGLRGGGG